MHNYVMTRLQEILKQLEDMTPLAPAGTPEALAEHTAWMSKHEQINDITRRAEWAAMLVLPADITEMLSAIDARKFVLLNLQSRSKEA